MIGNNYIFHCLKCGAANGSLNLLCVNCTARLELAFLGGPEGMPTQICPVCNAENQAGATVCRNCGSPLGQAAAQRQNTSSKPPSRLSRLAEARKAKEQSQPKTESEAGSDWFGSLRSEAAAVPIPENDEEEDETPVLAEEEQSEQPGYSSLSELPGLEGLDLSDFEGASFEPSAPLEERLRSRYQTGPLFAPDEPEIGLPSDSFEPPSTQPLFSGDDDYPLQGSAKAPDESDPNLTTSGFLPEWLRDLNPNKAPEEASPISPKAFQPDNGFALEAEPGLDLKPFELNEPPKPPRRETTAPIGEEPDGVPDWLREISGSANEAVTKPDEQPDWFKDLESQNTTKPHMEGEVPEWLRDISTQTNSRIPSRPTFGDAEVEATLNFAFGEADEKKSYEDPDELPALPPEVVKSLPPEAFRTGLTGMLGGADSKAGDFRLPSFMTEPPLEDIKNQGASDTLFVEETAQGEEIPFELPPLPDLPELEGDAAEEVPFEPAAEVSPLWGAGLPPWLQGLNPPSLEVEPEAATFLPDIPIVIGVPEEELGTPEEPFAPPSAASLTTESDVQAIFDDVATNPPNLTAQELNNYSKSDGSMRFKETRPFSLRDVLRQTDTLADRFGVAQEAGQRYSAEPAEPDLPEAMPVDDPPTGAFSLSSLTETGSDFPIAAQTEPTDQPEADDIPEWLRSTIGAGAPPAVTSPAQAEEDEVPDWLRSTASATPTPAEPEADVPDWLRSTFPNTNSEAASASEPAAEPALPSFFDAEGALQDVRPEEVRLPSFFENDEESGHAEEPRGAVPAEPQLPDFDFSLPEAPEEAASLPQIEPPAKPIFVPPLPPFDDEEIEETELKPFDLSQFEAQEAASPASKSSLFGGTIGLGEPNEEELPDWLSSGATPAPPENPPEIPAEFNPPASLFAEPALPETQAAPQSFMSEPSQAGSGTGGTEEEIPPWLQAMVAGQAAPPPTPTKPEPGYSSMFAGVSRAEEEQANLPDWLKDSPPSEGATPIPPATPSEAEDKEEVERLLESLGTASSVEPAQPADMPEWLRTQPATSAPAFELPEDLPDWLKQDAAAEETPFIQSEGDLTPAQPIQLPAELRPEAALPLNELNQELNQSAKPLPGGGLLEGVEGPAWLRGRNAEANNVPLPPLPTVEGGQSSGVSPTALPGWLRTVGSATLDQETATSEPFTVPGVLPQIALPPALASAAVLAALLNPEAASRAGSATTTPETAKKPAVLPVANLLRYLLYGLLLIVALFALLQPVGGGVLTVQPPVQGFYDTVNTLTPDSKVLVAYDWEGDRSGEMRPMATTLTQHIMSRRSRLVTVSLNSQGPALASQITDEVATDPAYGNSATGLYQYGAGYVNLGWRIGSEAAVRGLFNDMGSIRDYKFGRAANSYPAMQGINSLNDFDLVIVLAGDESSVRTWVEQFGIRPDARLLYGTPAAVAPLARPYLFGPASAQPNLSSRYPKVQGLLDGISGTAQYQQLLKDNNIKTDSKLSLDARLFAQSLAAILLILAVIVANVIYLTRKSRK